LCGSNDKRASFSTFRLKNKIEIYTSLGGCGTTLRIWVIDARGTNHFGIRKNLELESGIPNSIASLLCSLTGGAINGDISCVIFKGYSNFNIVINSTGKREDAS
jgi:phage tail sheath gpL-like